MQLRIKTLALAWILASPLLYMNTYAETGEAMRKLGNEPKSSTPDELQQITIQQITIQQSKEWGDLIERLHLQPK